MIDDEEEEEEWENENEEHTEVDHGTEIIEIEGGTVGSSVEVRYNLAWWGEVSIDGRGEGRALPTMDESQ